MPSKEFGYNPFVYNPTFDDSLVDAAIQHARDDWPNESCGAIINDRYERFENKADEPEKSFLINDNDFYSAYANGEVQAVIHSHEDYPRASKQDQIQAMEMEIPFGIISMKNKAITHVVFWGDDLPIAPLEKRMFFYGVFDCFGLVRDHIRMTYGVIPPNPPRSFAFWYKGVSMFEEYIKEGRFPFNFIDKEDVEPGDYVLYNINGTKYCNHIAIVESKKYIKHHFYNQISKNFPYVHESFYLRHAVRYDPNWEGWNSDQDIWSLEEEVSSD